MNGGFKEALGFVMRQECPGGNRANCKSNLPDDPGKATNQGVIQSTYDGWRSSNGLAKQSVFLATDAEIDTIYYRRFWLRGHCDSLFPGLDILHFDGCVNIGTEARDAQGRPKVNAITLLQRAANVTDDGVFGTVTRVAIDNFPSQKYLTMRLWAERVIYYDSLDKNRPELTKFLTGGWLGRLRNFYQWYLEV